MHNPADRQGGNTLIEVLVSIVVLSIGLLGIVGLHARTLQTTIDSENRASASLLLNEMTSAMWATHLATNNTTVQAAFNNWQAVNSRALPSGAYTVGTPDANGSVRITLTWVAPGQQSATRSVTSQLFTVVTIP